MLSEIECISEECSLLRYLIDHVASCVINYPGNMDWASCGIMWHNYVGLDVLFDNESTNRWIRLKPFFKDRLRHNIFCASTAVADATQGEANSVE